MGVAEDVVQGVIGLEALENEIPEGHAGAEEPLVEALARKGGQVEKLGEREELEENAKQFAPAADGRLETWKTGVFLKRKSLHVCIHYHIHTLMKQKNPLSPSSASFLKKMASLWPALKGSLALVHKPCIRPGCALCASGKKHPAHMLSYTLEGRRRCMYVPVALVPLIQRSLKNGRKIESLLCQNGPALVREYRKANAIKPSAKLAAGASKTAKKKKC